MPKHETMRITGGTLVRRRFLIPQAVDEGLVRPTPDRVRESLFSALKEEFLGAKVLDLFAGSGAHGYEAVSRGAAHVHLVEKDRRVAETIKRNIDALGLGEKIDLTIADAFLFVAKEPTLAADIIFLDPPYTIKLEQEFFDQAKRWLAPDGLIIFRCFKKDLPQFGDDFVVSFARVYGGTKVFVLRDRLT